MARLPEVSNNTVLTQAPRPGLSPADIANPYRAVADAFGDIGTLVQQQEIKRASEEGAAGVYRDEKGALKVDLRPDWTKTGDAYDRAATQAYTARLAGDIRTRGTGLANDAKGDVDAFTQSWKGFSDTLLKGVPAAARGNVMQMLEGEGQRLGLGVSEQKRQRDIRTFEGDIKSEIASLDDDLSALARAGGTGTKAYLEKREQLTSLYGELANNPEFAVGGKEAGLAMKRMESRHVGEAMVGHIEKTLQEGGFAAAKKEAEGILTDEKLTLSPAERRQYNGLADEVIRNWGAQQKADLKPFQDKATKIKGLLDEGLGIDSGDIDETATALARGGDAAGALELLASRSRARFLSSFNSAGNADQTTALERGTAAANGVTPPAADAKGLVEQGNIDLAHRPVVKNADGSISTVRSMSFEEDGKEVLVPTVSPDGKVLSDDEAIDLYHKTGQHLGKFDSADDATSYAKELHESQAKYYRGQVAPTTKTLAQTGDADTRAYLLAHTDKDASHIDGLNGAFAQKLAAMMQAAPASIRDGLGIYSGARSNERQSQLWAAALKKYGSAAAARKWVAPPGRSNHNHGLAADLSYNGQSLKNAPHEVVDWVHQNAGQFGLKFPLGNENWHVEDSSTRGGRAAQPSVSRVLDKTAAPEVDPSVIKAMRTEVSSDAKDLWTDMKAGMEKNMPPSADELNLLSRQLALIDDQDFRSEVAQYFQSDQGAQAIQQMPADQAAAMISQLKSDTADGASIAQQDFLASVQRGQEQREAALKADPVGYAVDRRIIDPVPAIDLAGEPAAIGSALAARQRGVDMLRARGDVGNVSALRPEDEQMLGRFIQTATPAEQGQILGSMAQSLKPDTYMATMAKLGDKSDTKAMAAAGAIYQDNPEVAEGILRGRQLLRENAGYAPKDTADNRTSVDTILPPNAFGPAMERSRQQLLEAATARYADLSNLSGDTSGELNEDRMSQAVNEVTGGMLDFNGASIIAPRYGMTQAELDTVTSKLTDADLAGARTADGTPITARDVRSYGHLRAVGQGQYMVEFGEQWAPTFAMADPDFGDRSQRVQRGVYVLNLGDR